MDIWILWKKDDGRTVVFIEPIAVFACQEAGVTALEKVRTKNEEGGGECFYILKEHVTFPPSMRSKEWD